MIKTPQEIADLKHDWKRDPCYDIEDAEGFEEHKDELLEFRMKTENSWEDKRIARLTKRSEELGIPGNLTLTYYLECLENKVEEINKELSKKINELDDWVTRNN